MTKDVILRDSTFYFCDVLLLSFSLSGFFKFFFGRPLCFLNCPKFTYASLDAWKSKCVEVTKLSTNGSEQSKINKQITLEP